ncbi:Reverse transcriptase [Phytophthora palmivora]|uniref:Reverse transcriptase n=1 Tax=Phytophthora palmivora TaxID=4796 RepID=A0A2P4YE98_9STRA|nr:Reverse transcriptase [Phytophthora palmivora]
MAGSLVYFFDIWVGDLTGQDHIQIEIGQSVELQLHLRMSDHEKFWVIRGDCWVPTVVKGLGKMWYLQITNVGDKAIILHEDVRVGIWLAGDHIPRMPGFVSVGSRRYMEWQNLADLLTGGSAEGDLHGQLSASIQEASSEDRNNSPDPEVHYHEGNELYPEDVHQRMAILPEINPSTDEVKIEDIQVRSPWASPIVVIVKKNGVDIRLCIDYRLVNSLTQLMVYPMPLINDLLEDLDKVLWYCSLDMASGFWVVTMTDRARAISAFITPFGLFEWSRMPFGLKNAPQICQRLIDNALYGFTRIPPPGSDPRSTDVFEVGEADDPGKPSVIGRRSYIDDILIPADSWDQLCDRVDALLEACDKWNLSISVVKCFWGMTKVEYLGHRVTKDGLEANPNDLEALTDLAFGSLRSMQSFLGSLNYYSRFFEGYAIYAAVLYELRDVDFAAMSKVDVRIQIKRSMDHKELDQLNMKEDPGSDLTLEPMETSNPEGLDGEQVDSRWIRAYRAFETLKSKIASTPILRHFDADREAVVIVYARDWAISAALVQEYDQIYYPITFVSRTLKLNELNYSPVEKEVLALLRILDLGYNMLVGRRIRVLTRYSTLAWLFRSTGLQGRLGQWASLLSPWTLEIVKCVKGEEETLGVIAASIKPRSMVDEALIQISPKKEPRRKIQTPIPVIRADEELYVVSFDGSARVKRGGGAYSAILWKLPEWTVIQARSAYAENLTVNEAEHHGLLLCLDLLSSVYHKRIVFCGDSNLVIRQVRGEIDCKAPSLTLLKRRALDRLNDWPDHGLVHVKRDWNGSADSLASAALQRQGGVNIESNEDKQDLITLNRLDEILVAKTTDQAAQITAVVTRPGSRSTIRTTSDPQSLRDEVVRDLRIDRIRQDEEAWISGLKKYLNGDLQDLTQQEAKSYANLAADYDLDYHDLLFYCPSTRPTEADRDKLMLLVIPETLYQDILHHYHVSLEGGHQGIGRTYQRIRDHFHWRGLYKSVQRYVGECVDCETGKSKPRIQGESPGNLQATYSFQIIAMDHIPSLPRSHKGNTELLIFEDLFSGYVIAKASSSRTAQTVAESYEECVFRRFGTSEAIRHDREPGFMSDFFRAFNKILERMVQTTTRAIKMYVQDLDQRDWDEYAERITFAINTAHDRIRGEKPFYVVHGWDPRSTLEAVILVGSTQRHDRDPRRWRYQIQRYYQQVREQVNQRLREAITDRADLHNQGNQRLREAISDRADLHNQETRPHQIEVGSRVWLYLDRVKEGYAKKLAHLWHGPFRIAEKVGEHAVRLEIAGSGYHVFPVVHVTKLKLVKEYPDRPLIRLTVESRDRIDFDEYLLPGDSWIQDRDPDEYEVEKITDMRSERRTRYGRIYREFLVHWRGYDDPT